MEIPNSFYRGTILATGSDIDLLGTAAIDAYQTQIIGWNVQVGGTSDTYVRYNDHMNVMRPYIPGVVSLIIGLKI